MLILVLQTTVHFDDWSKNEMCFNLMFNMLTVIDVETIVNVISINICRASYLRDSPFMDAYTLAVKTYTYNNLTKIRYIKMYVMVNIIITYKPKRTLGH